MGPFERTSKQRNLVKGFAWPVVITALLATVLLGVFVPTPSRAAPCVDWVGLGGNVHDWNDGANWLGGVVPGAADDACISPGFGVTFAIDHPADVTLASLTIGGFGTVNLRSPLGEPDIFAGGFAMAEISVTPGANLQLSGPTPGAVGGVRLAGPGFFRVDGHLTVDSLYTLHLDSTVTLTVGQALPHTDSSIINAGSITVEGEAFAESGQIVQNGPHFHVKGALRSLGTRIIFAVGGYPMIVGSLGAAPPTELTLGPTMEVGLRVIGPTKLIGTPGQPIHTFHTYLLVQGPLSLDTPGPLIIDPGGDVELAGGGSISPGPTSLPMDIVNDGVFVSNWNPFTGYRIGAFTNNGHHESVAPRSVVTKPWGHLG
jgi:hypothetical protein